MRGSPGEARQYIIIGHRLEVYLSCDGSWRIAVDDEELRPRFAHPYAAWAAGAAESYRRGPRFLLPFPQD